MEDNTARARLVAEHDLLYEQPPRHWEDGFPIGNGQFGAMLWQPEDPDRIVLGITKLDVWDYRHIGNEGVVPFDRFRALCQTDPEQAAREVAAEPTYDVPYPCPKLCGKLEIGIDEGFLPLCATLHTQTQRLRLADATVQCDYELATRAARLTGAVDPDANVLVLHMENAWAHDRFQAHATQSITLSREIDETLGLPEPGIHGGALTIRYRFPDGFEYVMALVADGASLQAPLVMPEYARATISLPDRYIGPVYTLYLTVVTSREAADPLAAALANLERAKAEGYQAHRERQARWWAAFWERSGIQLQDRLLESLWYFSLYQLASTCRGDVAPGLFGLWNMTKSPQWHGDYHGDYNISMAHWFLFSSNHLELGEPYFRTVLRLLPMAQAQTREMYQVDGAKYPTATGPDINVEMTRNHYRLMHVSSAYYAIPFWWRYLYSRDEAFLRDMAWPILEEASKFYLNLAVPGPDGRIVIGPSWAPEQGPLPAYNVNNELALIKPVWEAYVAAGRILGRETPWLPRVADCLAHYPDYPQVNDRFLDSATAPEEMLMAHTGLFSMVYPAETVDADHPLAEVAARTIDTYHQRAQRQSFVGRESLSDVQAWVTQALCSALLRRPDRVDHYLMDVGLSEYLKPNGMFTLISNGIFHTTEAKRAAYAFGDQRRAQHVIICAANTRAGRDRHFQFLEGPSGFLCILNLMLLQSHQGTLRIFPSVPERIADCAFQDLLAHGAFEVSARCRGGRVEQARIRSLAGEHCRVQLFRYDPALSVAFIGPAGPFEPRYVAPDTWEFATVPGAVYTLAVDGHTEPVQLVPSGAPASVQSFIDCYGEPIYYGRPPLCTSARVATPL